MFSKKGYVSIAVLAILGVAATTVSATNPGGFEKAPSFQAAGASATEAISVVSEIPTEKTPWVDDFTRIVLEQRVHSQIEDIGGAGYVYKPIYRPIVRPCWFCYPFSYCCP